MASNTCTVKGRGDPMTDRERKLTGEQRFCKCPVASTAIVARKAGLEEIPECVSKFTKLEKLDVSRNVDGWDWGYGEVSAASKKFQKSLDRLSGMIGSHWGRVLKDVRVRGNGLTSLLPLLRNGIEVLDFGENRLGWLGNKHVSNDTPHNGIDRLRDIDTEVKELYLDHNDLATIDTEWDGGFDASFKALEVLDLSHNRLYSFPGRMSPSFDPETLKLIDLSGNCGISPNVHTNNLETDELGRVLRAGMESCNGTGPSGIHPKPMA